MGIKFFFNFFENEKTLNYWENISQEKEIQFIDEGGPVFFQKSKAETVEEFLREQKISFSESDLIFPAMNTKIYSSSRIIIQRFKQVEIKADNQILKKETFAFSIEDLFGENNFLLGEFDIVDPVLSSPIKNGMIIVVTRVMIKEEKIKQIINFKEIKEEDPKISWRTKKVKQKGEKGIRELSYKIVYHNGKEITRKLLKNEIVKEPKDEIVIQGTYMKLGKKDFGLGTWYAWKGGLFAASRTFPRGTYVKVTNTTNEKSVIVQINDYGPFGKNRIIDLDKVAFAKIADLSAGVIDVKVEEILN